MSDGKMGNLTKIVVDRGLLSVNTSGGKMGNLIGIVVDRGRPSVEVTDVKTGGPIIIVVDRGPLSVEVLVGASTRERIADPPDRNPPPQGPSLMWREIDRRKESGDDRKPLS